MAAWEQIAARAARLGYRLTRGAYTGTTDNRLDRWYLVREAGPVIDRRGPGMRTLEEVEDVLLDLEEFARLAAAEDAR